MTKYLGRQFLEMDPRAPSPSYSEVFAMDFEGLTLENLRSRAHERLSADEITLIRQRGLIEVLKVFWSFNDDMQASFPGESLAQEMETSDDPGATMIEFIAWFLDGYFSETKMILSEEGPIKQPLQMADRALRMQFKKQKSNPISLYDHFFQELITGLLLWAEFIELLHRLYEEKKGEKMPLDLFQASLQSPMFLNIAVSLGRSSAWLEQAFLDQTRERDKDVERPRMSPDHFELIERGGICLPRLKDEVFARVKDHFDEKYRSLSPKTTCPASAVQGENGPVIKEFAAWVGELFAEYYGPWVCRRD